MRGIFVLLTLLSIASVLIGVFVGSVKAGVSDLISYLNGHNDVKGYIIWEIRIPRALAAFLGGACLALSGLLLQTYFRNPLAGPFVLGISSASSLAVALCLLAGIGAHSLGVVGSAFLGAMVATAVVIALAAKVRSAVTLLVAGLMLGYVFSALEKILITFAESREVHLFVLWTFGSFSGITWADLRTISLIGIPTILITATLSKPLNALLLGEDYAKSMGVDVRRIRVVLISISSLLTALITAFAGIVAFIGLAVPHIARLVLKSSDHRVLIPATVLIGGIVTVLCDTISRVLLHPVELPISVATSLFGAPIVMYLVIKRRRVQ